jgi:hypothetical protein
MASDYRRLPVRNTAGWASTCSLSFPDFPSAAFCLSRAKRSTISRYSISVAPCTFFRRIILAFLSTYVFHLRSERGHAPNVGAIHLLLCQFAKSSDSPVWKATGSAPRRDPWPWRVMVALSLALITYALIWHAGGNQLWVRIFRAKRLPGASGSLALEGMPKQIAAAASGGLLSSRRKQNGNSGL